MIFGPYDQHRETVTASRTVKVRDLDVRIDTVKYERFIGHPANPTILGSSRSYAVHVTRGGEYVPIYWAWIPGTKPSEGWSEMSHGALSRVESDYQLLEELRALPPEAIG